MTSMFQTLWSSGDSSGLLRLAQDIETHESWRGFLTIQEHDIFKSALDSGGRVWHEFINGNATCSMEQPTPDSTPTVSTAMLAPATVKLEKSPFTNGHISSTSSPLPTESAGPEEKQNSTTEHIQLDAVTVAFRVRYMLYEKSIGMIFPSLDPSISPDIDYAIFDEPAKENTVPVLPPTRKIDDDYDDDDDEDDDDTEKKPEITASSSSLNADSLEKPVILSMSGYFMS